MIKHDKDCDFLTTMLTSYPPRAAPCNCIPEVVLEEKPLLSFNLSSEKSEWKCHLFGGTPASQGLMWIPEKGCEPNWFWRRMQYLILGNLWKKEEQL